MIEFATEKDVTTNVRKIKLKMNFFLIRAKEVKNKKLIPEIIKKKNTIRIKIILI